MELQWKRWRAYKVALNLGKAFFCECRRSDGKPRQGGLWRSASLGANNGGALNAADKSPHFPLALLEAWLDALRPKEPVLVLTACRGMTFLKGAQKLGIRPQPACWSLSRSGSAVASDGRENPLMADFFHVLAIAGYFTGAAQSLFFLIFLATRRGGRTPANVALAMAALVFALCMLDDLLGAAGVYGQRPGSAACIGNLLPSLIGPFVFLHVEAETASGDWRLSRRHWRHGGCFFALLGFLVLALSFPVPSPVLSSSLSAGFLLRLLFLVMSSLGAYLVTAVQGGFYLYRAIGLTRQGRTTDQIRLSWLRLLLRSLAVLWALYVIDDGLQLVFNWQPVLGTVFSVCYVLVLYGLAWISLHHGAVFRRSPESLVRQVTAPFGKYRKSAQTPEDAQRLVAKIETVFERHRLFCDSNLSLVALAQSVGARPNAVSQAINQSLGINYFDFVNRYRIEEAKRLLRRSDDGVQTILDVALAVGFNSKSTFNAAFKKFCGVTPGDFRRGNSREFGSATGTGR